RARPDLLHVVPVGCGEPPRKDSHGVNALEDPARPRRRPEAEHREHLSAVVRAQARDARDRLSTQIVSSDVMVRLGCRSEKFFEWKRGRPDENVAGKRAAATPKHEQ